MAGVEIPNAKKIEFSLQYIYGVGPTTAKAILVDTVREREEREWLGGGGGGEAGGCSLVPAGRGGGSPRLVRDARPWRAGPGTTRSAAPCLFLLGRPSSTPLSPPFLLSPPPPFQGIENKRTRELTEAELTTLRDEVEKYTTEGDLRRFTALNIKRLKEIGSYRGRRHIANLPTRGQRTKTNARTRKGKAKTVANKKK